MTFVDISIDQRRMILREIRMRIPEAQRPACRPGAPWYPDSVPELQGHIDDLVQLTRADIDLSLSGAARIRAGICSRCPYQFPARYCPLRETGGCVPYQFAEEVAEAIFVALCDHRWMQPNI